MLDVVTKLGYIVVFVGCLVAEHYGLIPAGSEIIAVGLWAGEGIAAAKSASSSSNQPVVPTLAPASTNVVNSQPTTSSKG